MRILIVATSALIGALWGATVPVLALVLLAPAQYGPFSAVYLVFAYGMSLQYSIVSEAWARARGKYRKTTNWSSYSSALSALATAIGSVALALSLILVEMRALAVWFGLAVGLGVYRSGARYHRMAVGATRRVILADILGLLSFIVVLFSWPGVDRVAILVVAWATSGLVSLIALGLPSLRRGAGPFRWWKLHKKEITPLLTDSTLMDVGAIGAPFLLAGFMGPTNFGLYRGVANAAMPVRLLIDPLRPTIGRKPSEFFFKKSVLGGISGITFAFAAGCYAALEFLVPRLPVRLGTLSELVVFSSQAAVFTAASFVGTLFYVVCRNNSTRWTILKGRITQTLLVVLMPVIGFASFGLVGAVWGFSLSALLSAVVWMYLSMPPRAGSDARFVTRWNQRSKLFIGSQKNSSSADATGLDN
ncbi:hypothetical protein [Pseudarthrobacter oxydans]|uniref:hypothetical protein n=1 Tax=Pseudarthrobacter oxydans TaxID=1671 RepID=UPI00380B00A6